jgi:hypothetical protein
MTLGHTCDSSSVPPRCSTSVGDNRSAIVPKRDRHTSRKVVKGYVKYRHIVDHRDGRAFVNVEMLKLDTIAVERPEASS